MQKATAQELKEQICRDRIHEITNAALLAMFKDTKFKISAMKSHETGDDVKNQYQIYGKIDSMPFKVFQSYNSVIVFQINGATFLDKNDWNYSRTTSKYRNDFLGECTQETKKKIDSGEYILTELN